MIKAKSNHQDRDTTPLEYSSPGFDHYVTGFFLANVMYVHVHTVLALPPGLVPVTSFRI